MSQKISTRAERFQQGKALRDTSSEILPTSFFLKPVKPLEPKAISTIKIRVGRD